MSYNYHIENSNQILSALRVHNLLKLEKFVNFIYNFKAEQKCAGLKIFA